MSEHLGSGRSKGGKASAKLRSAWSEVHCSSIRDYLNHVLSKSEETGHRFGFRGVSKRFENLLPSLDRRNFRQSDRIKVETELLEEFVRRAWSELTWQERRRCIISETRWGSKRNTAALIVARHRLVPTRCMDWSFDPLVALFFSCAKDIERDGEVWWFDRIEFDRCVATQWPRIFGKRVRVEANLEEDFRTAKSNPWITGLNYAELEADRPSRQNAWITVSGELGVCHAMKIHEVGVNHKGRLIIPGGLKQEAMGWLAQVGITAESLGISTNEKADHIAREMMAEFERYGLAKEETRIVEEGAR